MGINKLYNIIKPHLIDSNKFTLEKFRAGLSEGESGLYYAHRRYGIMIGFFDDEIRFSDLMFKKLFWSTQEEVKLDYLKAMISKFKDDEKYVQYMKIKLRADRSQYNANVAIKMQKLSDEQKTKNDYFDFVEKELFGEAQTNMLLEIVKKTETNSLV